MQCDATFSVSHIDNEDRTDRIAEDTSLFLNSADRTA